MKTTHTWYTDDGEKTETDDVDRMVGERLVGMEPSDRYIAIGRLAELLIEKGVLTAKETGWALFFEEWS